MRWGRIAIAAAVLAAGAAAAFFLMPRATAAHAGKAAATVPAAVTVQVPQLITNLADKNQAHLVQVAITAKITGGRAKAVWSAHMPALQDATIAILRGQTSAELAGATGQAKLAAALMTAYDKVLGGGITVQRVYFTQFVIQ